MRVSACTRGMARAAAAGAGALLVLLVLLVLLLGAAAAAELCVSLLLLLAAAAAAAAATAGAADALTAEVDEEVQGRAHDGGILVAQRLADLTERTRAREGGAGQVWDTETCRKVDSHPTVS